MKVIYEANDGTKFDSETECSNYETTKSFYDKSKKIEELLDAADRGCDSRFYTLRNIADFIIENISEINEALGVKLQEQVIYTDCFGIEYVAVNESDRCTGCVFINGSSDCNAAANFFSCGPNKIIWIKK